MTPEAIALGRNLALILLIAEAVVLAVPLVVVPLYAIRYLRRFKAPIRPALRQVRGRVLEVERGTRLAASVAVQPFLWSIAVVDGLKRVLAQVLKRR
jgi:hypothetical protein